MSNIAQLIHSRQIDAIEEGNRQADREARVAVQLNTLLENAGLRTEAALDDRATRVMIGGIWYHIEVSEY